MYIYTRENTHSIARALSNDGNASWHENYDACLAMAEYLEQLAEDIGEPIELDIVAIRCGFSLMADIKDFNSQYNTEYESADDITETNVIQVDGESFIIEDF
jgi:hypothetical protein